MASIQATIAEKVKDLLAAGEVAEEFSTSIAPVRGYDTRLELTDLGTLHCDIVPGNAELVFGRGDILKYRVGIDIAIRKRFDDDDLDPTSGKVKQASLDALLLLEEEIAEYLARRANRTLATVVAGYAGGEITLPWFGEHLRGELRQFTGVQNVVYLVEKDISGA